MFIVIVLQLQKLKKKPLYMKINVIKNTVLLDKISRAKYRKKKHFFKIIKNKYFTAK